MCKSREGLLSSDSDDDSLNHSVFSQRSMLVQEGYHQDQNASGSPSLSGDPIAVAEVVDLVDNNDQQPGGVDGEVLSVDDTVAKVAAYCTAQNINNPVEILRCLQRELVIGRPLEVTDVTQCTEGLTNFILVDRDKLLSTAFEELKSYQEYRVTLEVQFYDEVRSTFVRKPKVTVILLIMTKVIICHCMTILIVMCSSSKYPYPPHRRFFVGSPLPHKILV